MTEAVAFYKKGNSLTACQEKFGIPRSTICERASGKHKAGRGKPSQVMTRKEEDKLATAMDRRAGMGVGLDYMQAARLIQKCLQDLVVSNLQRRTGFEDSDQFPSYGYVLRFAKRNNLVLRKTFELSKGREQLTETELREWLELTGRMMEENSSICQDPRRVFNYDETSFERSAGNVKVLRKRGSKRVPGRSSGSRNHSTLAVTVNAAGEAVPPRFVLEGKKDVSSRYCPDLEPGVRTGEPRFSFSESGFVNNTIFMKILQDLHDYCVEQDVPLPVLDFVDGALSHISLEAVQLAEDLQIRLWLLYPNATHLVQPLDVSVFGPFKRQLRQQVWWWHGEMENMHKSLSKWGMVPLVLRSLETVLASDQRYVAMGFRKSGLLPFNPEAVDFSALEPSTKFRQPCGEFVLWPRVSQEEETEISAASDGLSPAMEAGEEVSNTYRLLCCDPLF